MIIPTSSGDFFIECTDGDWDVCRSGVSELNRSDTLPYIKCEVDGLGAFGDYYIDRSGAYFDLSAIPAGAQLQQFTFFLWPNTVVNDSNISINLCPGTFTGPLASIGWNDWISSILATAPFSSIVAGQFNEVPATVAGKAYGQSLIGSVMRISVISSPDFNNVPPPDNEANYLIFQSSEGAHPFEVSLTYTVPTPSPLPGVTPSIPSDSLKHVLNSARFKGSTVLDTTNETGKERLNDISTFRDTILSVMKATSRANVHLNTSAGKKLKAIAALNPNTATAADIINAAKNT